MANKAVVSLAALGVGAYVAKEQLSDRLARAEVKRREEEESDRAEVMRARYEEASRKKGGALAWGEEIVFHRAVYERVDDALFELVIRAGRSAETSGGGSLRRLDLPLLGDGVGGQDVMLAAALAIGDGDVLSRAVLEFTRQNLGIGLKKFSHKSIQGIIRELEKVEDHPISMKVLTTFISLRIGGEDAPFKPGSGPKAIFLSDTCNKHYGQLVEFASGFGFHVTLTSSFRISDRRNKNAFSRQRQEDGALRHDTAHRATQPSEEAGSQHGRDRLRIRSEAGGEDGDRGRRRPVPPERRVRRQARDARAHRRLERVHGRPPQGARGERRCDPGEEQGQGGVDAARDAGRACPAAAGRGGADALAGEVSAFVAD
ncbi:hypothetical protein THAOC_35658, partial [Thalassiosira oceanica]